MRTHKVTPGPHYDTDSTIAVPEPGFFQGVLGTRFGSLELKIASLASEKIIIGPLESEKIGSLEQEKSGPCSFILGT